MRDDLQSSTPDIQNAAKRNADTMWACIALAGVSSLLQWMLPAIAAALLAALFAIKAVMAIRVDPKNDARH